MILLTVKVDGETPVLLIKLSEYALIATVAMGIFILIRGLIKKQVWKEMVIDFVKTSIICSAAHTPLLFVTVGDAIINFFLDIIQM